MTYPFIKDYSGPPIEDNWTKPEDWLTLPELTTSDEQISCLVHVGNYDGNVVSVTCAGAYTVNWGDGVTENFATGVQASHTYTYSDIDLDGTETADGMKQAILTITPQASNHLTSVNLRAQHAGTTTGASSLFVDIIASVPFCTTWTKTGGVNHYQCERMRILHLGTFTNLSNFCQVMHKLRVFQLDSAILPTDCNNMFIDCQSLRSLDLFTTSNCTNFSSMFLRCFSLKTIPQFNTTAGTNFSMMLNDCRSLVYVPSLNTSLGTTFSSMFTGCRSLTHVFGLNTAAATVADNMFAGCTALREIPALNLANVTSSFANFASTSGSLNCTALRRSTVTGMTRAVSYANAQLSATALNEIYTNLGTASGAQTITVTSNPGTATDTPSIATGKGWTVTG